MFHMDFMIMYPQEHDEDIPIKEEDIEGLVKFLKELDNLTKTVSENEDNILTSIKQEIKANNIKIASGPAKIIQNKSEL